MQGSIVKSSESNSLFDCQNKCIKEIACQYYQFNNDYNTENCWLLSKPVNEIRIRNRGGFIAEYGSLKGKNVFFLMKKLFIKMNANISLFNFKNTQVKPYWIIFL